CRRAISPVKAVVLIFPSSRRLVRHFNCAGGGEHAPDAVADRDFGVGDLHGGNAAHLAHAFPQCVHGYIPECLWERPPPLVLSGNLPPGAVLRSAMKAPASPRPTKPRSSRP